jgi:hypothetical protein
MTLVLLRTGWQSQSAFPLRPLTPLSLCVCLSVCLSLSVRLVLVARASLSLSLTLCFDGCV